MLQKVIVVGMKGLLQQSALQLRMRDVDAFVMEV